MRKSLLLNIDSSRRRSYAGKIPSRGKRKACGPSSGAQCALHIKYPLDLHDLKVQFMICDKTGRLDSWSLDSL